MLKVFAGESFPKLMHKSIFLAGPSPRDSKHANWRTEALDLLAAKGYDGVVFIPLPSDGKFAKDYIAQADWEQSAMNRSDIILFWVPRDLVDLPAFTTNIEFGQKCRNRNVVLGYPEGAPKCRFLSYLAEKNFVTQSNSLLEAIGIALEKLGNGALRFCGECQVPLFLWKTPHFESWVKAQKEAGNCIDGCSVELTFGVGPKKAFLLYWAAHMSIYVVAEDRFKDNEIVIGRPDIKHIIGYVPSRVIGETQVILVREFRSTASIGDCFVREVPGGSGFKPINPELAAATEFKEETGIIIDPCRLRQLPVRQLAATTTTHKAFVFAVELTDDELRYALQMQKEKKVLGNAEETERTYVEVYTVDELVKNSLTDWSNLGMILSAIADTNNIN